MILRYALLALLSARPLSAYDISAQFKTSVGFVWYAPDSQIYPQLKRMEADGLVTAREEPSEGRRTKRVYRITEEGVTQFREWINTPIPHQRERDVYRMRSAYFEWVDPEQAKAQLREHIDYHQGLVDGWLAHLIALRERNHPTMSARLAGSPPEQHDRIVAFRVYAYEGMVERSRGEIAWAERGLKLVDEMAAEPTPAPIQPD